MDLIIFDIDGTLIRSHGVGRTAFNRSFQEVLGFEGALDAISLAGLTDQLIFQMVAERFGFSLTQQNIDQVIETYLKYLAQGLESSVKFEVLKGVLALLSSLKENGRFGLAVGTGNIERGARLKLQRGGLDHFFSCGGYGSDAEERHHFLATALRRSEVFYGCSFDVIWVVGDTPRDVLAGKAIGARTLAVKTGDSKGLGLKESDPDMICTDLTDARLIDLFRLSSSV
jgi:phosphoglycolate phosphatase-like HAD superfamily hydrolase